MLKRGKNNSKNMVFFHLSRFINIDHFETFYITKNFISDGENSTVYV